MLSENIFGGAMILLPPFGEELDSIWCELIDTGFYGVNFAARHLLCFSFYGFLP